MNHRRLLICLTLLFAAATVPALAQIPRTISFQGVLATAGGVLVPDGPTELTVSIYDTVAAGSALFSETQTVQVVRGVFNLVIGSSNPSGIPASLTFDRPYWLGVRVAGGTELAPRTPFTSVPYALNAETANRAMRAVLADSADWAMAADTAVTIRGGHVVSVNGQQGAIEFLGAGATTVTRSGNQFIIRSTDTSGGAIRRIDNFDGSIVVDPPTGPFVTMFIREQGIQTHHIRDLSITTAKLIDLNVTTPKLANNAVTAAKVNTEGAPDGFALISNGTATPVWENPLTANIPYAETFNESETLWSLTNQGTGASGYFAVDNPANDTDALTGTTNGTGSGVLGAHTATTGTAAGVRGESNSTGANAVGSLGIITSTTPGGFSSGLRGINNGVSGLGIGVYGSQAGSGWGVYGTTPDGIGVHGYSANGFGMYALSTNGTGLYGTSTNGAAGRFEITNAANATNALSGITGGAGAAISGINNGTGKAGNFLITSAANPSPALDAATSGSGPAFLATALGTGSAASFSIQNPTSTAPTVTVATNGLGAGVNVQLTNAASGARGIDVAHSGVGTGVFATSAGGMGVWGITSSISAAGVLGDNTFGEAVVGRNRGGVGVGAVVGRNDSSGYGVRGFNTKDGIGVLGQAGISGGTGVAGRFENVNAANTSATLQVATNGIGSGITVQLTNAANGARGIDVAQSGVGPGVFSTSAGGNAVWGITSSISAAGVIGDNTFGEAVVGRNRGGNGVGAVVGRNDSSGYGVRGFNTKDGIGVLGQAGISGGTGVGGRFENVNAANGSDALQAATNGTGWAGNFTNANNSPASRGVRIATTAAQGGNALTIANGTVAFSQQIPYASNTVVDDAVLVVSAPGLVVIPTGPPLVDGATVWVVNTSGLPLLVANTTVGGSFIGPGAAAQFLFVSAVNGANWIPVQ